MRIPVIFSVFIIEEVIVIIVIEILGVGIGSGIIGIGVVGIGRLIIAFVINILPTVAGPMDIVVFFCLSHLAVENRDRKYCTAICCFLILALEK